MAKRDGILTAGEATNIAAALACLESGRYPEGEDAMMLAEKDGRRGASSEGPSRSKCWSSGSRGCCGRSARSPAIELLIASSTAPAEPQAL